MYRATLEQFLSQQDFTDQMLGRKVAALPEAVAAGTAPDSARDLAPRFYCSVRN